MAEQDNRPDDAETPGGGTPAEGDASDPPADAADLPPARTPLIGHPSDRSPDASKDRDDSRLEGGGSSGDSGQPDKAIETYLDAVNAASGQARGMWLGFLGLVAYLFVAIAGVTHVDLLLNSDVSLPIVNVAIPLFGFFIAAPALFVLVHLGLLIQHAMLSQKIERFLITLDDGVPWGPGPHAMRSRLHAYTQTQLLAGPWRSAVVGAFLHLMSWLTLYGLPVLLLLYFQLAFLPYHAEWVTLGHAGALTIDLLIVILIGIFIACPSHSFWRSFAGVWRRKTMLSIAVSLVTPITVYASVFVLTVPDRGMDALRQRVDGPAAWVFAPADWLTDLLFTQAVNKVTGDTVPLWKVSRNLIVADADLVPDQKWEPGEVSLSIRGRDLRFAILDRSDLHRADLTGSDLSGASLSDARLSTATLRSAELRQANLARAILRFAGFFGAKLHDAILSEADLGGADLRQVDLPGGDLFEADLRGADLGFANLEGAVLLRADLRGANLESTRLQGAHLDQAKLQGANLRFAILRGAVLSGADLRGADLTAAELVGTDLRGVTVWKTAPPINPRAYLIDQSGMTLAPLTEADRETLQGIVAESADEPWGPQLEARLAPLLDSGAWEGGGKGIWVALSAEPAPAATELSSYLANLACDDDGIGAVAKGLARRGLSEPLEESPGYNGDRRFFARAVTRKSCRGAAGLDEPTPKLLCEIAAWQAEELQDTICDPRPK